MAHFEYGPCDPTEFLGGFDNRLRQPPELAASPQTQTWVDYHRAGASMLATRIHEVEAHNEEAGLYVVRFTVYVDRDQVEGVPGHALFEDGVYLHEVGERDALLIPRGDGVAATPIEGYFRRTGGSAETAGMLATGQAMEDPGIDWDIQQLADDVGGKHDQPDVPIPVAA